MARRRLAFTLIELLVVMAIISILISLLVPAVQKVRESASRTQCENNMKNIALATMNFHDVWGHFPQGGGYDPANDNPAIRAFYFSWTFHIYPFLEQDALYKLVPVVDDVTTVPAAVLTTLDKTPVKAYYCPTRRSPGTLYHDRASCDYAGNMGTTSTGTGVNNGIIVMNSAKNYKKVKIANVTDGTSNTMMYGERRINLADMDNGLDSFDNEPCIRPGQDGDVLRMSQASGGSWLTPAFDLFKPGTVSGSNGYFGGGGIYQYGSSHPGGITAALADGTVRRIMYHAQATMFKNLCVRDDGNPVDFTLLE